MTPRTYQLIVRRSFAIEAFEHPEPCELPALSRFLSKVQLLVVLQSGVLQGQKDYILSWLPYLTLSDLLARVAKELTVGCCL